MSPLRKEGLWLSIFGEQERQRDRGEPSKVYVNFQSSLFIALCFTHTTKHVASPNEESVQPFLLQKIPVHYFLPEIQKLQRYQLLQPLSRITFTKFLKFQPHYQFQNTSGPIALSSVCPFQESVRANIILSQEQ